MFFSPKDPVVNDFKTSSNIPANPSDDKRATKKTRGMRNFNPSILILCVSVSLKSATSSFYIFFPSPFALQNLVTIDTVNKLRRNRFSINPINLAGVDMKFV